MARSRKKAKKGSNLFWYVLGGLILLIAIIVISSTSTSAEIDYSPYNYTDEEVTNADAEDNITVYEDFECPACGAFYSVLKQIKQQEDVHVTYKHLPLTAIHPRAQRAAEASECARDQNRFWAYHDVLYENQQYLSPVHLEDHAEGLGLDMQAFEQCMDDREKQIVVAQDLQEARELGLTGTPSVFVNGEKVNHGYANIIAALNS